MPPALQSQVLLTTVKCPGILRDFDSFYCELFCFVLLASAGQPGALTTSR